MEPEPVSPLLTATPATTNTPATAVLAQVQALTAGFTPAETTELTATMTAGFTPAETLDLTVSLLAGVVAGLH
ncbi:MAG: hypothetical protein ABIO33_02705, partial [Leifsonia sp.]